MKKALLFFFILVSTVSYGQIADTSMARLGAGIKEGQKQLDSMNKVSDSLWKKKENERITEDLKRNEKNLDTYLAERNEKERKDALTRIIIGLAFAILLVIGLLRKRKNKK